MRPRNTLPATLPFTLSSEGDKTQQMINGIETAIAKGHWKPGDTLPSAAQFQKMLGTGGYVPRTALRQLADKGVVILKQHVGAIVAPRTTHSPHGRIAFISSGHRESYYENVHAFCLQDIFEQAGWELVHIAMPESGKDDLLSLRKHLLRGIDFAVCLTESHAVATELDKAHVRYVDESGSGRNFPNAVASFDMETQSLESFERLTAVWKDAHVKNVVIVDFEHDMPRNVLASLISAGIAFRRLIVTQPKNRDYLMGIQQAGLDVVARFFANEKNLANPPDAIFFYDDYLAAGGLIALAATGLRVPDDIRVATFSNKGFGPVWFKPLTRLESDPVENARMIGDYVLKLLAGESATPPTLMLKFIQGRT